MLSGDFTQYVAAATASGGVAAGAVDRRHIVNLTFVYQTPKFSGRALRAAGTGWTLSTIYTARTGQPMSIFTGSTTR